MTRRVMSAAAAATLAHMMVGVVDDPGAEGSSAPRSPATSGRSPARPGRRSVALPNGGGYGPNVVASFVGFMPATNPQFTMMVILNDPQENHAGNRFGSILAAPIWKQMAEMMIDDWRIEP